MYYIVTALLLLASSLVFADELDPAYHNLDEIAAQLNAFCEDYPDWITVDSIGHGAEFGLPIYLAKLSDHPRQSEPEPALLFVGQVHAEEVIGVELVLELMKQLLENLDDEAFRRRLEGLELYFIPTANPDGLCIVHGGNDVTYRKNCRDNHGDGRFRFREGPGGDSSGVDINRNFGLHWDRGDTLFQPQNQYLYNYYRGSAPFSEPETGALQNLTLRHRFLFSICYHSSRSGDNAELVIAPWNWDGRYPPDRHAIDAVGDALAALIPSTAGDYNYSLVHSMQRLGQQHEWSYQATGALNYMIEVGNEIQPDSAGMRAVVENNLAAAFYLMDLALGQASLSGYGILNVRVEDAANSEQLQAVIEVSGFDDPVLEPRRTSELNGLFNWLLPESEYNVTISKFGYYPTSIDSFSVVEGRITMLYPRLVPIDQAVCRFILTDIETGYAVDATVSLFDPFGDEHKYATNDGGLEIDIPNGTYQLEIIADGYLPLMQRQIIESDAELNLNMYPAEVVFTEDFVMDCGWSRGGIGGEWGVLNIDGVSALTESLSGAYLDNMSAWLSIDTEFEFQPAHGTVFEIVHRPYFEPGQDYASVDVVDPYTGEPALLGAFSQFPQGWETSRFNISLDRPGNLVIGLRVSTDNRVDEDGWLIDKISIYRAGTPRSIEPEGQKPDGFLLLAYPNPFNGMGKVTLQLPLDLDGSLGIYDMSGRRIQILADGKLHSGGHRYSINGANWASGQYFLQLRSDNHNSVMRLVLVK